MLAPNLSAAVCTSTTDCTFTFDEHNAGFSGITSGGPYGTIELQLVGNTITAHLNMNSNWVLIDTGFPGTFGYNDTVHDTAPFPATSSDPLVYFGSANDGGTDTTGSDLHFDGFGYFDDAAATSGPHPGDTTTVHDLTFTISRTGGFSSVQQLIETPSGGGDGSAYFVADVFDKACGANGGTGCTGLVGVSNLTSPVPEPTSYVALLMVSFGAIVLLVERRRRNRLTVE
jgi:hypothetical protein